MSAISHIKNPLTIIGIFAGIVEISANVILPLLNDENQTTYMWFLMIFPTLLVAIFFAILNWNHVVLYAPSDYKDEDNFVNIHSSQKMNMKNVSFSGSTIVKFEPSEL
ncbi:hypothetical protein K5E59_000897 [Enterobacter hormaechei]|nr:hypothetical protein [Enterobacter hormaechei]